MLGVPLAIVIPLFLWTDYCDGISADEEVAEFAFDVAVNAFFGFFEHGVDVNVECFEDARVLTAVLEFDDNTLVAAGVQCVEGSCSFHLFSGERRVDDAVLSGTVRDARTTFFCRDDRSFCDDVSSDEVSIGWVARHSFNLLYGRLLRFRV